MTTASVGAGDSLPAFLPTAPPHQSSSSSSTTSGEIENAMEQLTVHSNVEQQSPAHQPHPLPPRPQAPRAFPQQQPMYAASEMVYGEQQPQPVWTAAYPLPPVFTHPGSMVSLDALGLVHGPPGARPMQPMYLPPPPTFAQIPIPPRPHPYLVHPVIYVSFVPADMVADDIEQPLLRQNVHPVAVRLPDAVNPVHRVAPDAYYTWMTKNGCLQFTSLHDAEKALSILSSHPYFATKGMVASPLPPPNPCPVPPLPVAPRFIRPVKPAYPQSSLGYPQPGELWDFARPWGSIREVTVMLEESQASDAQSGECRWRAKVHFWYEDEAHRFETSFMNAGPFAGWEIEVRPDPSYVPMAPHPFQQPMVAFAPHPMGPPFAPMQHSPPPMMHRQFSSPPMISQQMPPPPEGMMFPPMMMPMHPEGPFMFPTPEMVAHRGLPMMPDVIVSPNGVITPLSPVSPVPILSGTPPTHGSEPSADNAQAMGITYIPHPGHFGPSSGEHMPPSAGMVGSMPPPSPPNHPVARYVAPWASQNTGASAPMSPPYVTAESLPQVHDGGYGQPQRQMDPRGSWNKGKNWHEVSGGFVSEDGHVIQHVPNRGPHSPKKGGGGRNQSIDFCTLVVRNLSPDISVIFLGDQFSRFGQVANVRIMRDNQFRPRGFGFVSFNLPEDAANALTQMNGTELGGRQITLAYQERRVFNNARGFPGGRGRGGSGNRHSSGMRRDWYPKDAGSEGGVETSTRIDTRMQPKPAGRTDFATPRSPPAPHPKPHPYSAVSAPSRLQPNAVAPEDTRKSSVAYKDVTFDSLAVMSPTAAYAALSGGGQDLLRKLNLQKQVSTAHLEQSPASKKLSLISSVNKVIHHGPVHGMSPSRVVACIRDFVNGLDSTEEESLTELLHYPAVIHAMIVHRLKSPRQGFKSPPSHKSHHIALPV